MRFSAWALLAVVGTGLSACGEDSKPVTDTTGGNTPAASSSTAKPDAGNGNTPAPSASSPNTSNGDAGAPRIDMDEPVTLGTSGVVLSWTGEGVPCGNTSCKNGQLSNLPLIELPGCCDEGNVCGFDFESIGPLVGLQDGACEEFERPGNPDSSCPPSDPVTNVLLEGGSVVLEPCCQANGTCGYLAAFSGIGFGCLDPSRFDQTGGQSCTYQP